MCLSKGAVILNYKAREFATAIQFHRSLIFYGQRQVLPLEWSSLRGSALVRSNLACKYLTMVEVTGSGNTLAYDTPTTTTVK